MDAKTSTEALELLTTAVTVLDGDGRILDANAAAEILFGRARRRLAGRSAAEFLPEAAAPLSCEGRLRWGRSVALTTDLVIAPEAQERVRAVVHKLGRATEKPEGFLLEIFPLKDVLLQERERLRAEERAAGRDLLRNLAHEVKNPLGGIRGAAQLLEADLVRPEDRECTTMILEEADRLEALVERILLPYRAGGPVREIILNSADVLAMFISTFSNLIGADVVMIGGEGLEYGAEYLDRVKKYVLSHTIAKAKVVPSARKNAAVFGALAEAKKRVIEDYNEKRRACAQAE